MLLLTTKTQSLFFFGISNTSQEIKNHILSPKDIANCCEMQKFQTDRIRKIKVSFQGAGERQQQKYSLVVTYINFACNSMVQII